MIKKIVYLILIVIIFIFSFAGMITYKDILLYDSSDTEYSSFTRDLTNLTIDSGTGGVLQLKVAGTPVMKMSGGITSYKSIFPNGSVHNLIDLGTNTERWRNLYLGTNLYVDGDIRMKDDENLSIDTARKSYIIYDSIESKTKFYHNDVLIFEFE